MLLQHEFIVGNVTSCLVSLGQLYQGGWTIHKDDNSNRLSLQSPTLQLVVMMNSWCVQWFTLRMKSKIHPWTPGRWLQVEHHSFERWQHTMWTLRMFGPIGTTEPLCSGSTRKIQKVQGHASTFWDDWSIFDYSWFWRWVWIFDIAWCTTSNVVGTWVRYDRWWRDVLCDQGQASPVQVCDANFPQANPAISKIKISFLQNSMNNSVRFLKWKQVMKSKQRQMSSCTWKMSHLWYMMTWQLQLHLQLNFCVMPADGWEFLSLVQRRDCLTDARKPRKQFWDKAWWSQRMCSPNHCRKRLNQFQCQHSLPTGTGPSWANSCAISTLVQELRNEQIRC